MRVGDLLNLLPRLTERRGPNIVFSLCLRFVCNLATRGRWSSFASPSLIFLSFCHSKFAGLNLN